MSINNATLDVILRDIDLAIAPSKMTRRQAMEWLDELADAIDERVEALHDEIADEGK